MVNKNFSQIIYLIKEVIFTIFFSKSESLFREVSTNIHENPFLQFPNFFLAKHSSLKVYKNVLIGKMVSFSWTKKFAFANGKVT